MLSPEASMEEQYRTLFPAARDALSNYTSLVPLSASDATSVHATSLQTAKPLLGPVARLHAHSIVVLKLLPVPAHPHNASFRAADRAHRALREAAVMRALGTGSQYIVPLLSTFLAPLSAVVPSSKRASSSSELVLALVLPFHSRGSLADELKRRLAAGTGGFSEDEVRQVLQHVASALRYAHERGVVHRDVKAENILIARDGRTLLADWGLATFRDNSAGSGAEQDDTLCGTPLYLSPETTTRLRTGPAADVWALGCLCVLLLTGTPAFASSENSEDMQSLLDRIAVGDWEEARSRLNVSRSCRELLESMLAMEAEQRIDARGILEHPFLRLATRDAMASSSRAHSLANTSRSRTRTLARSSPPHDSASSAEEELEGGAELQSSSARVRKVAGTLPNRQPSSAPSNASKKTDVPKTPHISRAPDAASTPWARLRAQTPSARTASDPSASRTRSRSRSRTRSAGASGTTRSISLRSALENLSPEMFVSSMQGAGAAQESPSQRASRRRADVRRTPFGVLQLRTAESEPEEESETELPQKQAEQVAVAVEPLAKSRSSSEARSSKGKGKAREMPAEPTQPSVGSSARSTARDIIPFDWPPFGTLGLPLVRQRSSRGRLEICADGCLLLDVPLPSRDTISPSNLRMRISADGISIGALGTSTPPASLPPLEHAPSDLPVELADLYAHAARWLTRVRTRSPLAAFLISPPSEAATELGRATCTVMCNAPLPDYQLRWSLYGRGTEKRFSGELVIHVARLSGAVSITREAADEEKKGMQSKKLAPQAEEAHEGAKARHVLPLLRRKRSATHAQEEAEIDWRTPIVRNLAPVEQAALQLALGCTATVQHVMEGALDRQA